MSFQLDTNVVSEVRKPRGNANVKEWFDKTPANDLYLSVLVVGEVRRGVELLRPRDPEQAAVYEDWRETLRRDYAERILPVADEVAEEWGRMNVPGPVPAVDGLMAATAKARDMTFVTRNTAHVAGTGVRLLNPFEACE